MIETAPKEARGGNSAFTGGAFRFTFSTVEDLSRSLPTSRDLDLANIDFGSYTAEQYYDDMHRLTEYRCDPELTDVLIGDSYDAALWLKKQGVRFQPALGRQAFKVGRQVQVLGRACVPPAGRRRSNWSRRCTRRSSGPASRCSTTPRPSRCSTPVAASQGVRARRRGEEIELRAKAVVLACGGFESNPEMRARYLGPELGPRQGARHPLQHRPGPPHGDRHRARPRTATGRAPMPCSGT